MNAKAGGDAPPSVPLVAVWVGLLAGLAEAAGLLVKKYLLGILILANVQVVWMGPLAYVLLFLPLGIVVALLRRRWSRVFSMPVTVALFTAAGTWFALGVFRVQLIEWAALILAAGVAVRAGSYAAEHPGRFAGMVRRGTIALVALIGVLTAAVNGSLAFTEHRALGRLPAAAAGAPNILLIILDTVRALDLGLYGYARPTTPEIERHARTGVVFDRAVAPASWTIPTHASIFTGRLPHELSADWGHGLDGRHPTLAEVLRDHGYRTAGFIANTRYVSRPSGLARGFVHWEDHRSTLGAVYATTALGERVFHRWRLVTRLLGINDVLGRVNAPVINTRVLRWLEGRRHQPFFVTLNYMDAHPPFRPPEPHASRYGVPSQRPLLQRIAARFAAQPAALQPVGRERGWIEAERAAYDASIAYLDHQIGELLDELERRGDLDNTLVILTSDHGEEFREHGLMGHGQSLYWPSIHVPLVVWFRGRVPSGVRIGAAVSLRDIAATIHDVARIPGGPRLPGASLARHWDGPAPAGSDTILSELSAGADAPRGAKIGLGDMKSLVIGTWHYIRNGDGSEELYDVAADPWEHRDLVDTVDAAALAPFRGILASLPAGRRAVLRRF